MSEWPLMPEELSVSLLRTLAGERGWRKA